MNFVKTELEGVVIIEPKAFTDERGWFSEVFSQSRFIENVCDTIFVQDNESCSRYGVIRGLHYQLPPFAQSKLVRAIEGTIIDVAVDIRKGSPTFGRHVAMELSAENRRQLFVPRGFAHGFAVLSPGARVHYKCDNPYAPQFEGGIVFNDPELGIDWGLAENEMVVSQKDLQNPGFRQARLFEMTDKLY